MEIRCRWHAALALAGLAPLAAAAAFSVAGRQILLDGEPFAVRGVCYNATPIGVDASAGPPYGDYYTPEYRADTERDLANLRRMGANVLRGYGWTPGAGHLEFLDRAYNGGNGSIYVLVNRWVNPATDWGNAQAVQSLKNEWVAIATEVKDHPAVMGFLIGNEVNETYGNGDNPAFWAAMDGIAAAVKAAAPGKLVTTAITDRLYQVGLRNGAVPHFDFWAVQVYRGIGFFGFFETYAGYSQKPLVITEFGYDAYDNSGAREYPGDAAYPADVVEGLWNGLRANTATCSGACVFEYRDEWWKAPGSPWVHDTGGFTYPSFPDGALNEEWWGIFRASDNGSNLDILEPRALFYRLAAMWNPPFLTEPSASATTAALRMDFSYPAHLRDQRLALELSSDLSGWVTVADNAATGLLVSSYSSVFIENVVTDGIVHVTVHRYGLGGTPVFLRLRNGGR